MRTILADAPMKIHVNRIPAEGLQEDASYDPKLLDLERVDVRLEEPVTVSARITKAERTVVVQADIRCRLMLSCARCLSTFESPLQTNAILAYQAAPSDILDITEDIRQEIMLVYPMIPLCREACKGLCRVCGQDLNQEGACRCDRPNDKRGD